MVNAIRASTNKRRQRTLLVGDRDGWICWICKRPVDQDLPAGDPMHASLDHEIPRRLGGSNAPINLRLSHHKCNHDRDAKSKLEEAAQNLPPMPAVAAFYAKGVELGRLAKGQGRLEYERSLHILSRWLPRPPAVGLDVGGGPGVYSFALAEKGYRMHLLDLAPSHLVAAGKRHGSTGLRLESARVGDARALPYDTSSADFVLLMGPLYHLTDAADRRKALREAARCLRPGGTLVAAAISRYASLMDGAGQGYLLDPAFQEIVSADLATGHHSNPTSNPAYFTTAYFHRPEDLRNELQQAGFKTVEVVGVEGPVWTATRLDEFLEEPRARVKLLEWLAHVEREPSIVGASAHLLARGTKG